MRRCIGCMESKPKVDLLRVACYKGQISIDPGGKAKGRGVYLCRSGDCIEKAKKRRALQRNFEADISATQLDELFKELDSYAREAE